ncbi:MAG: tetratricopeptide repeat protein, partial [Myxococcota bacterium]
FLLAKVNTDAAPQLSQRFGIRGIPAVKAIVDGRVVDEFTGALPKAQVQKFLQRIAPGEERALLEAALSLLAQGALDDADAKAQEALAASPQATAAWLLRADIALRKGMLEACEEFLAKVEGNAELASVTAKLRAELDLVRVTRGADDVDSLRTRLAASDDPDAAIALAAHDALAGDHQRAFDALLHVMNARAKTHKAVAHPLLLSLLHLVDDDSARVMRRRLSMALY